jgi:DNA-binding cell septation regulator SpoVG
VTAPITVLAIRPLDGKSTVKAFVDVRLGGVTIKGCKIVRQEGQKPWLAMPATKSDRGWNHTVELTKELRSRVTDVVLAAWEPAQGRPQRRDLPVKGQSTWDASRDLPHGETRVIRNERRDSRQERIDELAARFDERGPDQEPGF